MNAATAIALALLISYFIGSIPFGWIIAKLVAGIDIRKAGSGNIGATNVARVVGAHWGMAVLVLDALKGVLPTRLLPRTFLAVDDPAFVHLSVACGMATILGHNFPCWLSFRGGKGVATSLGVIAVLGFEGTVAAALTFLIVFGMWRIVSLGSILAATAFGVCQAVVMVRNAFAEEDWAQYWREHWSLAAFCLIGPLLIVIRHRANIARLLRGEEPKFGAAKKHPPQQNEDQSSTPQQKADS
jgi:glycerol-3-phosphate acyltransferase PlsY